MTTQLMEFLLVAAAVGLLVYGSVVISGSDNFVRPLAMHRGAELNSGLLVLGIFGGVAVFGFLYRYLAHGEVTGHFIHLSTILI